jgi:hypothetical protein
VGRTKPGKSGVHSVSDVYGDLREIKERLLAAEAAVDQEMSPLAHIRKAINLCDEWLEDE